MSRLIKDNKNLVDYIPQQTMTNQTIFNSQLTKDESIFNDIKLKCYINKVKLHKLLRYSNKILTDEQVENVNILEDLKKKLKKNDTGCVEINYKRKQQIGRTYSHLNIQGLKTKIRNTLFDGKYYDIDMKNAHPSFINHISNFNGYKNDFINEYFNNRDKIMNELLIIYPNITKKDIKLLFIRLIYGGSYNKWLKENDLLVTNEFVIGFEKEVKFFSKNIYEMNSTVKLPIKKLPIDTNQKTINYTKQGRTCSYFLQNIENTLLELIYDYLKKEMIIDDNAVLMFDGIMVEKSRVKDVSELIKNIEKNIFELTNFNLKLDLKDTDDSYDEILKKMIREDNDLKILDEDVEYMNEILLEKEKTFLKKYPRSCFKTFNFRFFKFLGLDKDSNYNCDYILKREYFRKYFVLLFNGTLLQKEINISNGKTYYENITKFDFKKLLIRTREKDNYDNMKINKTFFYDIYKIDEDIMCYNNEKYNPIGINNVKIETNYFNTFSGFPYADYEDEQFTIEENDLFNWYLKYLFKYFCNSDKKLFKYYQSHMKNILINPKDKNGISIVLYSKDKGGGKNVHCNINKRLYGEDNCVQSQLNKLFNDFGSNDNFLIGIYDEISTDDLNNSNYSKLKTKITEINSEVNQKHRDIRKTCNFTKYWFLTNEINSFRVDSDERRFLFLNVLKEYDTEIVNEITSNLLKIEKSDNFFKLYTKWLVENDDIVLYKNPSEWNINKPMTEGDRLFKNLNTLQYFLKDLVNDTLNIHKEKRFDFYRGEENNNIMISVSSLYLLFLEDYNNKNNNTKSFGRATFNKYLNDTYNKSKIIKKDREEIICIDKKYFIERLKQLKIINDEIINLDDILNNYKLSNVDTLTKEQTKKQLKKILKQNKPKQIIKIENINDLLLQNDNNSQKIIIEEI
jgi:hypothetical protein